MAMNNIMTIFTSEEQTEIKQAFKDILIENFRFEIENCREWYFCNSQMENVINEMLEELMYESKDEFKGKLKKKLFEALDKKDIK
jgi:hypothetical protein